jgi:hypothetical protein
MVSAVVENVDISFEGVFGFDQPTSLHQSVLEVEMILATGIILEEHARAAERKIECVTALNMAGGRVECEEAMANLIVAEDALEKTRIRKDAALSHIAEMYGDRRVEFMTKVDELLRTE